MIIIQAIKKYKKSILWSLSIIFVVMAISGSIAYSKRDQILNNMLQKALYKAKNQYHLDVEIDNIHFSGLRTLVIDRISVVPEQRDSLLKINNLNISIEIIPLIFGNIKLSNISLDEGKLLASFKKDQSNLDFLLKRKKSGENDSSQKKNLAQKSYQLMKQILNKIPSEMDIQNFKFELNDHDSSGFSLWIQKMNVNGGDMNGKLKIDTAQQIVAMKGNFNASDDYLSLSLLADTNDSIRLSYLEKKLHLKFNCKEVELALTDFKSKNNETQLYTHFETKGFKLYHPKIASRYIEMPEAKFDANIFIGENYIALDSSSKITIGEAYCQPFAKYTPGKNKIYELGIQLPQQEAQKIIKAFPQGTFESFEGMETDGDIAYKMHLYLDTQQPDKVQFTSDLIPYNFKIKKYGKVDFGKINKPFVHAVYEDNQWIRNIEIGPNNPNYTPYNEISPQLIQCVLTSEDPSFFSNNGFVLESIRKSIATNFKQKKFARGGSTISMQLVKNAFLNREKTLVRKIEEMAIVWLMHNQKIVSKQRMLEVYFNIIELGKNIYGIKESTQYYFGFSPSDITLGHGLFYSNIIPSPKKTMSKFMSNGHLKPYLFPYFKFIGNIMAKKGLIAADGNGYGFYNVTIQPNLRIGLDAPAAASQQLDSLASDDMGDWMEDFRVQNPTFAPNNEAKAQTIREDSIKNIQSKIMDSIDKISQPKLSKKELRKLKRNQEKNN